MSPASSAKKSVAVIGGGWAGLAAAVEACAVGHAVRLFEMAPQLGGRARRIPPGPQDPPGLAFDNGQHILIGAYTETLRLMRLVGVDIEAAFDRRPLSLRHADGNGLSLPRGPAWLAFARGALAARGWTLRERLALLHAAGGWLRRGFRCDPSLSVAQLTAGLPQRLRDELLGPMCVAALNTPIKLASAAVFLRVLHDALFAGAGASDLLLPRVDLSALWPDAAARWLDERGVAIERGRRVQQLQRHGAAWLVDDQPCDAVILACSANEAARLAAPHATDWADEAGALRYEPIVTVLLHSPGIRLAEPMLALRGEPAQYVFDLGQLRAANSGAEGVLAAVISGASQAMVDGLEATTATVTRQLRVELDSQRSAPAEFEPLRTLCEKRATFLCTPGLRRPAAQIAPGLWAAADYVAGPYPATLEGAVRSGIAAARSLT